MTYQVLLVSGFHGAIDTWTEYLCLETRPDGVELTSRSAELLMGEGWAAGDVVWPEGHDPENDPEGGTLPVSVGGKAVGGQDGDFVVGEELVPHSDDATAIFRRGQVAGARSWLEGYGWSKKAGFADAWLTIEKAVMGQLPG